MPVQVLRPRADAALPFHLDRGEHPPKPRSRLPGQARAIRKGAAILLWTFPALIVQAAMLALPGRGKVVFARQYWAGVSWLLGLEIRVVGLPAQVPGRAVVFAANHTSWLDIPVLGGRIEACFVSKGEIARWPVVSTVARLGRTVFVSRKAASTGRERDDMRARLAAGDNLLLFPEGTSSDGSRVLPFRTPFFAVAEGGSPPLVQPVSIVYDRLVGLPVGRNTRPVFAWYGDMDMGSHFWRLAQWPKMRATILLHPPLDPASFPNRKELARTCWTMVANGAAQLRQNRPVNANATNSTTANKD